MSHLLSGLVTNEVSFYIKRNGYYLYCIQRWVEKRI